MKWQSFFVLFALLAASCSDSGTSPQSRNFNLEFSYGVNARNVLNTFDNTYTKDLVMDGTTTVHFVLSDSELDLISSKISEMGFFSYPDTFVVTQEDSLIQHLSPSPTYVFHVRSNSTVKDLYWSDSIVSQDSGAVKLRGLITLIEDIIESNQKYSQLPPARGAYL